MQNEHGISTEQSHGVINTETNYIKEKLPMVGGMLDNLGVNESNSTQGNNPVSENSNVKESTFGKLEDLAKNKVGGMFGGNA